MVCTLLSSVTACSECTADSDVHRKCHLEEVQLLKLATDESFWFKHVFQPVYFVFNHVPLWLNNVVVKDVNCSCSSSTVAASQLYGFG